VPSATEAFEQLDALLGRGEMVLRSARALPHRYGRIVAYAYARRDDGETFV